MVPTLLSRVSERLRYAQCRHMGRRRATYGTILLGISLPFLIWLQQYAIVRRIAPLKGTRTRPPRAGVTVGLVTPAALARSRYRYDGEGWKKWRRY
jgi:hypothetical protein